MSLRIGEKFRYNDDGYSVNAVLVYNRLDENYSYLVVNTSNYEAIEAYSSIDRIPVYDVVSEVASEILTHKSKWIRYSFENGNFKLVNLVGDKNPFEVKVIYSVSLHSEKEINSVKLLCEAFDIAKVAGYSFRP